MTPALIASLALAGYFAALRWLPEMDVTADQERVDAELRAICSRRGDRQP